MIIRSSFKKRFGLPLIAGYQLTEPWRNTNSGNARWSFARKNGKDYFIKEFLSPSRPADNAMSPEMISAKRKTCDAFYQTKRELYDRIERSANGNIVTVKDFFLFGTKYYITTDRVSISNVEIQTVAAAPEKKKLLLLNTVANSIARLHQNGVVHADLKPNNVLIKVSETGNFIAKLIDFDGSYVVGCQPGSEEVQGDLPYLAPETCRYMFGESVELTQKVDVFAAGLLFHQYYTGELPGFSAEYESAHEALLEGEALVLSDALPQQLRALVGSMLEKDPEERPDMESVLDALQSMYKPASVNGKTEEESRTAESTVTERDISNEQPPLHQLWYRPEGF